MGTGNVPDSTGRGVAVRSEINENLNLKKKQKGTKDAL